MPRFLSPVAVLCFVVFFARLSYALARSPVLPLTYLLVKDYNLLRLRGNRGGMIIRTLLILKGKKDFVQQDSEVFMI